VKICGICGELFLVCGEKFNRKVRKDLRKVRKVLIVRRRQRTQSYVLRFAD